MFTRSFPSVSNFISAEYNILHLLQSNYLKSVPKSFIFIMQLIFFFFINIILRVRILYIFYGGTLQNLYLCLCISTTRYMSNASLYIDRRHCNPYNIITVCVRRGWHTAVETGDGPDRTLRRFRGLKQNYINLGRLLWHGLFVWRHS